MLKIVNGPLLGSFCAGCSLHCFSSSVVCRLLLFHFGVFPRCFHYLVHSVVAKLVVSKNCPKLVHKYLQNYSKTQHHKKLKLCQKLAWNLFCDKKSQSFWSWWHQLEKIEIKVLGKINFYKASPGFSYFYSMIQDDPNAANMRKKTRTTKI